MGLAEKLDGLVVEVSSPDGRIWARVRGMDGSLDVGFHGNGAYRQYSSTGLARQLVQLATATFTGYRRAEQKIVDDELDGSALRDDGIDFGPQRRRYLAALAQIAVTAASADRTITVATRGMVRWEVTVFPDTVSRLTEQAFLDRLTDTAAEVVQRYRARVALLKDDIYDLGYPDGYRIANGIGRRGEMKPVP